MTSDTRRASGTRSPADVLLRAIGLRRRTPANDLNDLASGVTFKVTCLIRTSDAGPKSLPINGSIYLSEQSEPEWRPYNERGGHSFPGPLRVTGPSESRRAQFAAFQLSTAVGIVTAFIPKSDVPLVKQVMQANGAWAD
jgi:hypothetical protein